MKPIRINFFEDQRWKLIWAVAVVVILCIVAITGWRLWQLSQEHSDIEDQIRKAQTQMMQLKGSIPTRTLAQQTELDRISRLLAQDLNKVFGTIEGISDKGVRLVSMSFDANSGAMELTYELESIELANVVTQRLNLGYDKKPWHMKSLSSVSKMMSPSMGSQASAFRANWTANYEGL